jgi:hypothetical protein
MAASLPPADRRKGRFVHREDFRKNRSTVFVFEFPRRRAPPQSATTANPEINKGASAAAEAPLVAV